ncbi:MAG: aldo/keto reductase [Gemmatimonadaceae bacterium]|nr:aldo/keto reductase [Gemmatimonadaceae bacterium]
MHQMIRPADPAAAAPGLSPIVAGAWRMGDWHWTPQERLRWIEQCLDLGVTTFDHADIYGGYAVEQLFGEALALAPGLRQRMQLVTKCGICLTLPARPAHRIKHYDTSFAHIVGSVEHSLRMLGTEQLDLVLIHRPDVLMDADVVAEAFTHLQLQGKVRLFGVSNFTPSQFELLASRVPLVTNQVELHPLHLAPLTDGTLDQAQRLRLSPMIWSPLAGGRLMTDEGGVAHRVRVALAAVGARHGVGVATMAFAWLLRHPSRPIPVAGSRRIEAMQEAVAALGVTLDAQDWTEIWMAASGHEVA